AIWHGFNMPLVMSLVAIVGGTAGYLWLRKHQEQGRLQNAPFVRTFNGRQLFETALIWLTYAARSLLRVFGTRRLQTQAFAIISLALLFALLSTRDLPLTWGDRERIPASPAFAVLWFIGGVCALGAAVMAKFHRLVA